MHGEVTRLLAAHRDGDRDALNALLPLVYEELRRLARARRLRFGEDVGTTSLVHEAYLNLVEEPQRHFEDRRHFLYFASVTMRNLLIDHARGRLRQKRGAGAPEVPLDDAFGVSDARCEEFLALDEVLERLQRADERLARIVECRFFGGLTIDETADALGVSEVTVRRGWNTARAWLFKELDRPAAGLPPAEPHS